MVDRQRNDRRYFSAHTLAFFALLSHCERVKCERALAASECSPPSVRPPAVPSSYVCAALASSSASPAQLHYAGRGQDAIRPLTWPCATEYTELVALSCHHEDPSTAPGGPSRAGSVRRFPGDKPRRALHQVANNRPASCQTRQQAQRQLSGSGERHTQKWAPPVSDTVPSLMMPVITVLQTHGPAHIWTGWGSIEWSSWIQLESGGRNGRAL